MVEIGAAIGINATGGHIIPRRHTIRTAAVSVARLIVTGRKTPGLGIGPHVTTGRPHIRSATIKIDFQQHRIHIHPTLLPATFRRKRQVGAVTAVASPPTFPRGLPHPSLPMNPIRTFHVGSRLTPSLLFTAAGRSTADPPAIVGVANTLTTLVTNVTHRTTPYDFRFLIIGGFRFSFGRSPRIRFFSRPRLTPAGTRRSIPAS